MHMFMLELNIVYCASLRTATEDVKQLFPRTRNHGSLTAEAFEYISSFQKRVKNSVPEMLVKMLFSDHPVVVNSSSYKTFTPEFKRLKRGLNAKEANIFFILVTISTILVSLLSFPAILCEAVQEMQQCKPLPLHLFLPPPAVIR